MVVCLTRELGVEGALLLGWLLSHSLGTVVMKLTLFGFPSQENVHSGGRGLGPAGKEAGGSAGERGGPRFGEGQGLESDASLPARAEVSPGQGEGQLPVGRQGSTSPGTLPLRLPQNGHAALSLL